MRHWQEECSKLHRLKYCLNDKKAYVASCVYDSNFVYTDFINHSVTKNQNAHACAVSQLSDILPHEVNSRHIIEILNVRVVYDFKGFFEPFKLLLQTIC